MEKLEQTEKERDNLLSRIITGSKRPAPSANFSSNMDRNAQLMQQFSPTARAAARQQQSPTPPPQLHQFIPRQQQFYVHSNSSNNNNTSSTPSSSLSSPVDAKK